ncbi:MAG: hypothetical protein EOP09_13930, partial [Proteobacteria bacterium]
MKRTVSAIPVVLLASLTLSSAHSSAHSPPFETLKLDPQINRVLGNLDPSTNNLKPLQTVEGSGVRTEKFQHYYQGVEVFGSWAFVHEGKDGQKVRNSLVVPNVSALPAYSADQATQKSIALKPGYRADTTPELKFLANRKANSSR